jgi:outer membrane protein assembly factor BamB
MALLALMVVASVGTAAAEPSDLAAPILDATGVRAGLAVHLGTTDGGIEIALAQSGRMLVHGLATDDACLAASRRAIQARGIYGLASVEKAATLSTLPYAQNLVNLLVADLDALDAAAETRRGEPAEAEILRVLCPGGAAYLKRGGRWVKSVKSRPSEMDSWTHFDYGPEGNGVSHDRLAGPSTFVQWIAGVQPIKLGGNPAGFRVYAGMRVAEGRAFFEWGAGEKSNRETFYNGRDAFNGLSLWNVPSTSTGRKDWQFVAAPGRLYTFLEKGGPLVALDADTGQVVQTYENAAKLPDEPGRTSLRLCDGTILDAAGDTLYAIDAKSGALRWKHTEDAGLLCFPSATAKAGRVFAIVADAPTRGSSRWPVAKAQAVVCLDLADGKPVWRNTEVAGGQIGQLVYADDNLGVFGAGAIGGGEEPFLGNIRVADGKLLWHSTFQKKYNRFGYNMLARDGTLYYADAWRIYALDPKTGEETRPFDDGGYNMRCNRFAATENYFLYGLVAFVDRRWNGAFQSITRSGCALGAVPANGMTYFTPNACGCITQLRGHAALSSEPVGKPIADDLRLQRSGANPDAAPPPRAPKPPDGPVAEDWLRGQPAGALETAPVALGGTTCVAITHEHRLEARDAAGKAIWSFTAGGRISSPPVIADGLCLFGSHDGWVYCLSAATGELAWRFMAAPYEHKVVAYGQLESSWPVYGVVMHEGLACFSSGVHPEVGGGIFVYGVEPGTGKIAWKKVFSRGPVLYDGKSRMAIRPNRILNDVLKTDGPALSLPGITFEPREPDTEIQKKVAGEAGDDKKPKGKK